MGEKKRRLQYDLSTASPKLIFPEDIPVLMRKTAEDLAGAYHDEQLDDAKFSNDEAVRTRSRAFRAHWPSSRTYIRLNWPMFVPLAKTILGNMLTDGTVPLALKDEIYEAFLEMSEDANQLDLGEHLVANMLN